MAASSVGRRRVVTTRVWVESFGPTSRFRKVSRTRTAGTLSFFMTIFRSRSIWTSIRLIDVYWTDRGDPPRGNTVNPPPMDPEAEGGKDPEINYHNVQQDILETFIDRGQLRKLAEPTLLPNGKRIPGLKLDHPRQLAVMHALVRFSHIAAQNTFTTSEIYADTLTALAVSPKDYTLASLRYDLSKRQSLRCHPPRHEGSLSRTGNCRVNIDNSFAGLRP
jgi:hypothetical protein